MAHYNYHALRNEIKTSRFFDLLPGHFDDEIRVHVFQMTLENALPPTAQEEMASPTRDEISETVSTAWEVLENLEGHFVFKHRETETTSWLHPEAHIYRESYTKTMFPVPHYEAISYTWGSADSIATIHVDTYDQGEKRDSLLVVPQNLEIMLRYIRYTDRKRTLWADSISINQYDLKERNAHVKRMAQVYGFAQRVIVWLGPPSINSRLGIRNLDLYAAQVEYTVDTQRLASPHARYARWHLNAEELPFGPEVWEAILDLLSRPWFDRLWVLQEIQLANPKSIMQCGTDYIDWPRLQKAVLCLRGLPGIPCVPLFRRLHEVFRIIAPIGNVDFLRLPSRAQRCSCLDQRDKVYGVLSLAGPQLRDLIRPDYAKPIPTVYTDAFKAIVKHTNRLEILSYCMANEKRSTNLPSWVPDWSYMDSRWGHLVSYGTANLTAGHTRAYVDLVSDTILHVAAIRVAKVQRVHTERPKNPTECLRAYKQWNPSQQAYPTGERVEDAFALTLVTGFVSERFARSPVLPGHVIPTRQQTQAVLDFVKHDTMPENLHDDLKEVFLKTQGRLFLEIEGGYYGLTSVTAQTGDYVCTVLGCDHLIILRASEDNRFTVIGPCYVHGLWDGEPILGRLSQPWTMKLVKDETGIEIPMWFNADTSETTLEDPRLGELPSGWMRIIRNRVMDDPLTFATFENPETGETLDHDPRVSIEILRARDLPIETLALI